VKLLLQVLQVNIEGMWDTKDCKMILFDGRLKHAAALAKEPLLASQPDRT
jgi:uncharacterized membrane protein YecN with MAPEG domain